MHTRIQAFTHVTNRWYLQSSTRKWEKRYCRTHTAHTLTRMHRCVLKYIHTRTHGFLPFAKFEQLALLYSIVTEVRMEAPGRIAPCVCVCVHVPSMLAYVSVPSQIAQDLLSCRLCNGPPVTGLLAWSILDPKHHTHWIHSTLSPIERRACFTLSGLTCSNYDQSKIVRTPPFKSIAYTLNSAGPAFLLQLHLFVCL